MTDIEMEGPEPTSTGGEDSADSHAENDEDEAALPEDLVNETDAIIKVIMDSIAPGKTKKRRQRATVAQKLTEREQAEKDDAVSKADQMFLEWKKDPTYHSQHICDKEEIRGTSDRFSWVNVGALCWVKHKEYDWWPGIIRFLTRPPKTRNITSLTKATVIFVEPDYSNFLQYKKKGQRFNISSTSMVQLIPMSADPETRPDNQIQRSNKSWLTCNKYLDHTMFELAERMAVVIGKVHDRLVQNDTLDVEFLGGIYWQANALWLRMNGGQVDLPQAPDSCKELEAYLEILGDVSYWREPALDLRKFRESAENEISGTEVDEENDGCYGYEFIQISTRRRSEDLVYSEASQEIVKKRVVYAEELLEVIRSKECRLYLRGLRDMGPDDVRHTERSRCLRKQQMWKLLYQNVRSPAGPIVNDSQVFALYRLMRYMRRRQDTDNVKFLRACYDVWLPESLIYAIQKVKGLSYEDAEVQYARGPEYVPEEVEANWDKAPTLSMVDAIHREELG